ncbi:MAG: hypothetical protein VYB24_07925, partial [Pseudomonadota bacterium]|nr:hypothetical protein [Pseudomonadota bacterium]
SSFDLSGLPAAPWAEAPLASNEVPAPILTAWARAENRTQCAPLAPASFGAAAQSGASCSSGSAPLAAGAASAGTEICWVGAAAAEASCAAQQAREELARARSEAAAAARRGPPAARVQKSFTVSSFLVFSFPVSGFQFYS